MVTVDFDENPIEIMEIQNLVTLLHNEKTESYPHMHVKLYYFLPNKNHYNVFLQVTQYEQLDGIL